MLEAGLHNDSCFATLTYNDESLPENGTLRPRDMQGFLKRLRWHMQPEKLRFFYCGEYGEKYQRPHYHAALFGIGRDRAEFLQDVWGLGFVDVGDLTVESAQYVAGYVTKKMTHPEDKCTPKCKHPPLNGRHREFARMSLRPGIGAGYCKGIAEQLNENMDIVEIEGDVPINLKHGKRNLPLGRYLRKRIRKEMGFESDKATKEGMQRMREKDPFYQVQFTKMEATERKKKTKKLIEQLKQKHLNFEARQKIFTRKEKL